MTHQLIHTDFSIFDNRIGSIMDDPLCRLGFMGIGSTGIASATGGANVSVCEIDAEYFAIAKARLEGST